MIDILIVARGSSCQFHCSSIPPGTGNGGLYFTVTCYLMFQVFLIISDPDVVLPLAYVILTGDTTLSHLSLLSQTNSVTTILPMLVMFSSILHSVTAERNYSASVCSSSGATGPGHLITPTSVCTSSASTAPFLSSRLEETETRWRRLQH